jgi:phosphoribosyl-AMP cyclohydrolase
MTADDFITSIAFNADGLVPVIAQDASDNRVLMLAWMNEAAVRETLATRRMCYWSRSRKSLWRKGETSGNTQALRELLIDCDGDTLLAQVEQKGPACHTGNPTCFFTKAS